MTIPRTLVLVAVAAAGATMPAFASEERDASFVFRFPRGAEPDFGLVLAAGTPIWANADSRGGVRLMTLKGKRTQILYAARKPNLPPSVEKAAYRVRIFQEIASLEASGPRLAFLREVKLHYTPRCRDAVPPCMAPELIEPFSADVVVGSTERNFTRVAFASRAGDPCRPIPTALDIWRSAVVYAQAVVGPSCPRIRDRASEIVLLSSFRSGTRRSVLARTQGVHQSDVTIAGRYVAWAEQWEGKCPCAALTIYDRVERRTILRLPQRLGAVSNLELQPDGKLAFVGTVSRDGCGRAEVGYLLPRTRGPRYLGRPQYQLGGFARNRVVYVAGPRSDCSGANLRLVVTRLGGGTRSLRRLSGKGGVVFELVALDFDGLRVAYAGAQPLPSTSLQLALYIERIA